MADNAGKSFAERYAKKPDFTSQKLATTSDSSTSSASSKKQIDPQKKMMAELIYLVKGIDNDRKAWYYVLVDRLKVQLFLKALNDDIIHLEKYGKILYSAYGEEPPVSITEQLKEEYGIED